MESIVHNSDTKFINKSIPIFKDTLVFLVKIYLKLVLNNSRKISLYNLYIKLE